MSLMVVTSSAYSYILNLKLFSSFLYQGEASEETFVSFELKIISGSISQVTDVLLALKITFDFPAFPWYGIAISLVVS